MKIKEVRRPLVQIYCFPHAGGGASSFSFWSKSCPDCIEISALQLPGHENRILEALSSSWVEITSSITESIMTDAKVPYVFFGHSMGTILAYEVARRIRGTGKQEPIGLFLSGRNAPTVESNLKKISDLPDAQFYYELVNRYGAEHAKSLLYPEIREVYLPILRNDLKLVESYNHDVTTPLNMPFFIYYGKDDKLTTLDKLCEWRYLTAGKFSKREFEGDHFYYQNNREELLKNLAVDILRLLG